MSSYSLLTMRERKLQAAAICREIQGPDDMGVGRKVKAPKEIMLEELSLASNRGSRLFKLRQQRSEKYTYDSIQQNTHLTNGVCVPHAVESVVEEAGNHGDESSDPVTSADPDSIAPGYSGPLKDVPAERFNLMSIPSPWQQALGNDPALTHTHLPSMLEPEPKPETPSYKSFNRVAIPFGGFERAAKLPAVAAEEAPPSGQRSPAPPAETITLRPKFNRTALGWISHCDAPVLPSVALQPPLPLFAPESEEL